MRGSRGWMVVVVAAAAGTACADSVMVVLDAGATAFTDALSGFGTTGDDMGGMTVTVNFSGGATESALWDPGVDGDDFGSVTGTGWVISETGTTFSNLFHLANNSGSAIDSIVFDGTTGVGTIFDTYFGGLNGTFGSFRGGFNNMPGVDFFVPAGDLVGLDIEVTFLNEVALTGDAPVGDLFTHMVVDFVAMGAAFANNRNMGFGQDTDNTETAGDIITIPLPAGAAMGGVVLCAIGTTRRRRYPSRRQAR